MNDLPEFVMEREFDAPREMVWKTWTEADHLARWYGPGMETVIHKLEVVPGGLWLNEMRMPNGSGYQKMVYTEVVAPERLVMTMSMTDADWTVAPNPMQPDWPKTLLTTVTFEELGDRTRLELRWVPHGVSEAEVAFFRKVMDQSGRGWGAGFAIIDEILAEERARAG